MAEAKAQKVKRLPLPLLLQLLSLFCFPSAKWVTNY